MENRIVVNNQCKAERRRANFLLVVFVSVVIAALMWVLEAQSAEPTLKETIEFIDVKLSQCGEVDTIRQSGIEGNFYVTHDETIKTRIGVLQSNRIYFEANIHSYKAATLISPTKTIGTISIDSIYRGEVSLRDLSTDVVIEGTRIVISCSRPECIKVTEEGIKYDMNDEDFNPKRRFQNKSNKSVNFFAVCKKNQEKIVKALTHAIKISGGKEELF